MMRWKRLHAHELLPFAVDNFFAVVLIEVLVFAEQQQSARLFEQPFVRLYFDMLG